MKTVKKYVKVANISSIKFVINPKSIVFFPLFFTFTPTVFYNWLDFFLYLILIISANVLMINVITNNTRAARYSTL